MNEIASRSYGRTCDPATESPDHSNLPADCAFAPISLTHRADGWNAERQRQFIEELADSGIVREAAARVGMSEQSAYRLRRRPDAAGFNRAWDAAVRLGADRLHSMAFERAIAGTVRRRYFHGEVVGEERVFDNRLLIFLLGRLEKKRDYDVDRVIGDWEGAMGALEDGIAAPLPGPDESHRAPVQLDEGGNWVTSFAPPEGFAGWESSWFGDEDYWRQLAPEELASVEVWQARLQAQSRATRERYFARLRQSSGGQPRQQQEVSVEVRGEV